MSDGRFVYIVSLDEGWTDRGQVHVKIGLTKNFVSRMTTFTTCTPYPVLVENLIPSRDIHRSERFLHLCFHDHRVNGEWFALEPGEIEDLRKIKSMEGADVEWSQSPTQIDELLRFGELASIGRAWGFKSWLRKMQQSGVVGDFARDVLSDHDWPDGNIGFWDLKKYLESQGASNNCMEAFYMAWGQWSSTRKSVA